MNNQVDKSLERVLREYYLDYVNNFLTRNRFAEYHGIPLTYAELVINMGEYLHEEHVEAYKQKESI